MSSRTAVAAAALSVRVVTLVIAVGLLSLVACGSADPGRPPAAPALPAAADLLRSAATAMASVKTAAIEVRADPAVAERLFLQSATGRLTAAGEGTGLTTWRLDGKVTSTNFVVAQGMLLFEGPTPRTFQQMPLKIAADVYPINALGPNRGISALVGTATDGTTEAKDEVDGVPTYRIRAKVDPRVVPTVMPGVRGDEAVVWLDLASTRVVRVRLDMPTVSGQQGSPTAPITVEFSDFDSPVAIPPILRKRPSGQADPPR